MPPRIRYDDEKLETALRTINGFRQKNAAARAGLNPAAAGDGGGTAWAGLTVIAGGEGFASGMLVKRRIEEIGRAVDKVLADHETKLAAMSRALIGTRRISDETEKENIDTAGSAR